MDTPVQPAQPPSEPAQKPLSIGFTTFGRLVRDLAFALLVALFIIVFIYQPVRVEGSSMEPGLEDQERIFINKLVYRLENISRGDIIVFRYPRDPNKSFIKRVVGLPGDRVRIAHGQLFVNARRVAEPYVPEEYQDPSSNAETLVPLNSYFVLGDHRSQSKDSREFGPVPRENIYGKAVFGYWPMEKLGVLH